MRKPAGSVAKGEDHRVHNHSAQSGMHQQRTVLAKALKELWPINLQLPLLRGAAANIFSPVALTPPSRPEGGDLCLFAYSIQPRLKHDSVIVSALAGTGFKLLEAHSAEVNGGHRLSRFWCLQARASHTATNMPGQADLHGRPSVENTRSIPRLFSGLLASAAFCFAATAISTFQ